MNKYQEALDELKDKLSHLVAITSRQDYNEGRTQSLKEIHNLANVIQGLVDKRNPISPEVEHIEADRYFLYCGNCHEGILEDWTSCPYCTQEIDWSVDHWEEDEE